MEDVSSKKVHSTTPYFVRVSGPRLEEYMIMVLEAMMKDVNKNPDFKPVDYRLKYKNRQALIKMKLIKVTKTEEPQKSI